MKILLGLFVWCFSAVMLFAAEAYVYHGALALDTGEALPADGRTVMLAFRLYAQPEGGDILWEEAQEVTCDAGGNFVVALGELTPDLEKVFAAVQETLYLGVAVNDATELSPRQRLLSVPTVYRAVEAAYAYQDFPIEGSANVGILATNMLSAGTITTSEDSATAVSFSAERAVVAGAVEVDGDVTVGRKVTATYGLEAPAFDGYAAALPGMILPWWQQTANEAVPDGWVLCDGNNGTPNLSGLFVIGAGGTYEPGSTGGSEVVTLTEKQLPPHTHSVSYTTGEKMYNYKWADVTTNSSSEKDAIWTNYNKTEDLMETHVTTSVGGGKSHENRPPYRALYYIMRK